MTAITDRTEIARLRNADPFRPIHPETIRLIGWGMCVLSEWTDAEAGWTAPVTDDDGAAAGNIVRTEGRVVATGGGSLGWEYRQQSRKVAINQNFVAAGEWSDEALTWGK